MSWTAEEWIDEFCRDNGIDWLSLTDAERVQVARRVPCRIRCWRVGGPVDVSLGHRCPECGRVELDG